MKDLLIIQDEVVVDCLSLLDRNRNKPRRLTGARWVRERFEAVEIPLKRMKKSRNARNQPLRSSLAIQTLALLNLLEQTMRRLDADSALKRLEIKPY